MIKNKAVYLGFHKTGTSSMGRLFQIIGLKLAGAYGKRAVKGDNLLIAQSLNFAKNYDAFQDNPWPLIYKDFDKKFPNSKFIFYERDVDDWYASSLGFFKNLTTPMRKYIYGEGCGSPVGNEKIFKQVYLQHSEDVIEYFKNRPTDLLHIKDFSDESAQQIGKFLGYSSYANLKMPHLHKGKRPR